MKCRKILGLTLLVAVAAAFAPDSLFAASAQADLAISASVTANCTISTTPVAFGSYDPVGTHASTPLDANGSVTIQCTKGSDPRIGLDLGDHASGTTRRMQEAVDLTEFLTYELYKDSGYAGVWGNTAPDDFDPPGTSPNKSPQPYTVYGRILANQDVKAGNYTDTVRATVNF